MTVLVTPERFKALHLARNATGVVVKRSGVVPVGVRKESIEPVEKLDDRTLRFVISTGAVDRDRDSIDPKGWELDNYGRNPVVLWAHQASMLPIGKALDVIKADDRLRAVVRFLPEEGYGAASAFADQVFKLARDGYLAATSVGFRPLSWDFTEDEERGADDWWPGIDFHSQELVELSIVSVPANPEALIDPDVIEQPAAPTDTANYSPVYAREHEMRARRRRAYAAALLGVHGA